MKKISIIAMAFLLIATMLTGCRRPDTGTTGATNNNPSSSSVVRPDPSITKPSSSGTQPEGTNAGNGTREQGRMGGIS